MEYEKKATYAVWVGNLPDSITEHTLYSEFECYGPISNVKLQQSKDGRKIAFVNFYNKEVAEVAANDIDGSPINGVNIKASFTNENHEVKDVRPLTDCQYFMQGGSCPKAEKCAFRHSEAARRNSIVCSMWKERKCIDQNCVERHPGSKAMTAKEAAHSSEVEWRVVGVYWDIENCQLPSRLEGHSHLFVEKIRSSFLQGKKLEEFICCCDNTRIKKSVIDGLSKAEVDVLHISSIAKNAADDKLKLRMQDFGYKYRKEAAVVLISGDISFAQALQNLRYSLGVHVILLHKKQASSELTTLANKKLCFDHFISDIMPNITPPFNDGILRTKDLSVRNLPFNKEMQEKVRTRLSNISGNCGGRVSFIQRDHTTGRAWCIISFPSADDANRALQRMQGMDVYGRQISVDRYFGCVLPGTYGASNQVNKKQFQPSRMKKASSFASIGSQRHDAQQLGNPHIILSPGAGGRTNQGNQRPLQNNRMIRATSISDGDLRRDTASNRSAGISPQHRTRADVLPEPVHFGAPLPHSFDRFPLPPMVGGIPPPHLAGGIPLPPMVGGIPPPHLAGGIPPPAGTAESLPPPNALGIPPPPVPLGIPPPLLAVDPSSPKTAVNASSPSRASGNAPSPRAVVSKTFGVWVGNLADDITESILFSKFKCYGHIRNVKVKQSADGRKIGFINFFTKEAATVAANKMNGSCINGVEIRASFKSESHKPKDIRPLIDCQHFMKGKPCPKVCRFRHHNAAKLSSTVCEKWLNRECGDVFCGKRHPVQKKKDESFVNFKQGLISLLCSIAGKEILYKDLLEKYNEFHGYCPQLLNLGFDHPNDLFAAMEPQIAVKRRSNDMFIALCENDSLSLWDDVLNIILESSEKAVLLCTLPQKIQDREDSLFSSIPPFITVLGSDKTTCFILTRKYEELIAEGHVTNICKRLYGSPGHTLSAKEVYIGLDGDEKERLNALRMVLSSGRVSLQDDNLILNQKAAVRFFALEVISLLYEQPEKSCSLLTFRGLYHKKLGRQYKVADFGFNKALEVFNAAPSDMIQVTQAPNMSYMLSLLPTGNFFEEAKKLLLQKGGLVMQKDLLEILKLIQPSFHRQYELSTLLESYPEFFATFNLKSKDAMYSLILWKNFSISLQTNVVPSMRKIKKYSKLPAALENEASQTSRRDHCGNTDNLISDGRLPVPKEKGAIKVNEKEGNETKLDVIDDQMSSYTDSSDDSSVISESEDLLDFSGAELDTNIDWLMQDVPDYLPGPAIMPEPIQFDNDNIMDKLVSLGDDYQQRDTNKGSAISADTELDVHADLRDLMI